LGAHLSDQDYEFNPALDQRNHGGSMTFDYASSPRLSLGAFAVVDYQDYDQTLVDSRETAYGLRMRYSAWRNLELHAEATHARRTDISPLNEFEENRIYAAVVWRGD
jgi:hypothetical protein